MNIERLTKIAEWLEGGAKHVNISFDMTKGLVITEEALSAKDPTACGTVCCIAGAAIAFNPGAVNKPALFGEHNYYAKDEIGEYTKCEVNWERVFRNGMQVLGLTEVQAWKLFTPRGLSVYNDPAWAARTIRRLIATGEVDWEAARDEEHGPA